MIAIFRTESLPINDDSDLSTQLRASENSIHLARLVRAHLLILDAGNSAYPAGTVSVIVSGLWPYSNSNTTVAVVAAELGMPYAKDTFLFNLREGPRQPTGRADRPRTSPTPAHDPAPMTTSFARHQAASSWLSMAIGGINWPNQPGSFRAALGGKRPLPTFGLSAIPDPFQMPSRRSGNPEIEHLALIDAIARLHAGRAPLRAHLENRRGGIGGH
jgi:hypothetical protein